MTDKLEQLFLDPSEGLSSLKDLIEKAKEKRLPLTQQQIKDFYYAQPVNQIYHSKNKQEEFQTIKCEEIGCLQSDLMDISKYAKQNHNYHFIHSIIDVRSRYGWAFPLKDKSAETIAKNVNSVMNKILKLFPKTVFSLTTDSGKEFVNKYIKEVLKHHKVLKFFVNDNSKQSHPTVTGIIERWHRVLWNMFKKYTHSYDTLNFIDKLQLFVDNYNNRVHGTIGTKPVDVLLKDRKIKKDFTNYIDKYPIDSLVRIQLKSTRFDKKSFNPKYSQQIYFINKNIGNKYYLTDYKTMKPLDETYSKNQLLLVSEPIDNNKGSKFIKELKEAKQRKVVIRKQNKSGLDTGKEGQIIIPKALKLNNEKRIRKPNSKYM